MICGVIAAHELARALVSYYNGDAKQTRACAAGPVSSSTGPGTSSSTAPAHHGADSAAI
jgi:hypothetical protein